MPSPAVAVADGSENAPDEAAGSDLRGVDGGGWTSPGAGAPAHCLYFLVSAATEGPLAGAFKLGIAERFPARYRQHTQTWGKFDLSRSALLRTNRRREVQKLERALLYVYGDGGAESSGGDAGGGAAAWRRHPGRRADGHTEWFDAGCLPLMLEFVRDWLARRGPHGAGASLRRGLDATDCEEPPAGGQFAPPGVVPPGPGKEEVSRPPPRAPYRQILAAARARRVSKAREVLDFVLTHERYLLWVDLSLWRWLKAQTQFDDCFVSARGKANLYFGGFGHPPTAAVAGGGGHEWPEAQVRFEAALGALVERPRVGAPRWGSHPAWDYEVTGVWSGDPVPHPLCRGGVCLRVDPRSRHREQIDFLFVELEALAVRVEGRHAWEQPELRW